MRHNEDWTLVSIKWETNTKLMNLKDKWEKHNMDEVIKEILKGANYD